MSKLRISDAPLLPDVDGTEKIPTGGRGDYAISVNQIKGHIFQDIGKELVGLGNVDNTSDLDKPVSTAQQAALTLKADKTYVDTNLNLKADKTNVYTRSETTLALSTKADLVGGVIPSNQLPSYVDDVVEYTTSTLPLVGESGKIYITTDTNRTWRWSGNQYVEISNGGVSDSTLKLQTPRKIANVDFDGTQSIEIPHNNLLNRDASGAHPASAIFDSSINRAQDIKNKDLVSVKDFGAKGDGVTDDAPVLNSYIASTEAEDKRSTYFYFPNYDESYLVNSPVNWVYGGVLIFGFKGGTYNTSRKRKGNIVVNNTNCGFNIGADRTLVGITDGWEVRNIGFVQHPDLPVRSADAIRISAKTDGPDRGLNIYGVTSREMNRGIYIPSNSATVMGGTLVVEKCYLNNNNYALVIDQKVEGLRFVGNQAEQNHIGCIDVVINGGVTITDNMLEGQKNAINIRGIKPKVEIKRNYFESNYGDYVVQFSAVSQDASIEMVGNFAVVIAANTDYFRIVNNQYNYAYKVINEDLYPTTFVDDANITPDSRIVNRQVNYYFIKSFNGNRGVKVYNENWSNLTTDSSYTQMTVRGDAVSRFVDTPFGKRQIPNANDYFVAGMNVAQGDMIAINCLFKVVETSDLGTSGIDLRVFDQAVTNLTGGEIWDTGFITSALANKYILFSGVIKASKAATNVLFQMFNSERDIQMVGACAKNLGQFSGKFKHKQVMPSFDNEFVGTDTLSSVVIADGVRVNRTVTVTGARLGQFVDVSFTANQGGVNIYGFVTASDTVAVILENRTGASQTLTGTLRVKTKKAW